MNFYKKTVGFNQLLFIQGNVEWKNEDFGI